MSAASREIVVSLLDSFDHGIERLRPYPHWFVKDCLPARTVEEVLALPFSAADLGGVSGKRELHNATRHYFDVGNRGSYPCVEKIATALQDRQVTSTIERRFGARLGGTYLRIEFAQDVDGFWLEPHTDLGVKTFTMLLYLSRDPSHHDLGTDIYDGDKRHFGRSVFAPNGAMVFIPGNNTYHGFERRPIKGVRTSLIINYVTNEWRAREQLSFPEAPIA